MNYVNGKPISFNDSGAAVTVIPLNHFSHSKSWYFNEYRKYMPRYRGYVLCMSENRSSQLRKSTLFATR